MVHRKPHRDRGGQGEIRQTRKVGGSMTSGQLTWAVTMWCVWILLVEPRGVVGRVISLFAWVGFMYVLYNLDGWIAAIGV